MSGTPQPPTAPATMAALRLASHRKLIPLDWLAVLIGMDVDDVLESVESRAIGPAFNLATSARTRRKIHLWRGCVEQFERGRVMPQGKVQDVIAAVLPPLGVAPLATVTVRAVELARRWCLAADTVAMLLRAGELREVGKHDPAQESPRVSYTSARQFLERRAL